MNDERTLEELIVDQAKDMRSGNRQYAERNVVLSLDAVLRGYDNLTLLEVLDAEGRFIQ